ncbi:MAG: DUF1214 domain-containing protein [Acidimicrobiales bacterium]|nr:DUF1214 domain-containing protein [Acidimicrobiales bacterium]
MSLAPRSTAAFDELIDALVEVRNNYVLSPERDFDEGEVLEGYRYALQFVSQVSELLLENDPLRPRFSSIVSPARKFLGDNPDSIYHQAAIRGDASYRITGRRTGQDYISYTVHGPDPKGGYGGAVLADVNDGDITFADDGTYEIVLSATRPDDATNWIELQPDACLVIVRNYYQHEHCIQNDPEAHIVLDIEPLEDLGPSPAVTDDELARRLQESAAMLRAVTLGLRQFGVPSDMPFAGKEPNTVGTPWSFRASGAEVAGAVDIFYSTGSFELEPGEALVMEGTIPPSRFTNVMLWNVHMQTLDYRTRQTSLNESQIVPEPDGSYRIVISDTDPGVPNWIDTAGHRRGTIFWRFLLPESDPETPRCRVVPVADLTSGAST